VRHLRVGALDSAIALFAPAVINESFTARSAIAAISDSLRTLTPDDSLRLIGWNVTESTAGRAAHLTYEVGSGTHWFLAVVDVQGSDAAARISGLHLYPRSRSLLEANAFSLGGRSIKHYIILLLVVLAAGFSIATAVIIARTRALPRRWAWVFVALLGAGTLTLDWTTGAISFRPAHFQLFSSGFLRMGPAAPWLFSVSVPLGAVIALLRRQSALRSGLSRGTDGNAVTSDAAP
jgi:hypothetical protein